jgi:hypothetical protein
MTEEWVAQLDDDTLYHLSGWFNDECDILIQQELRKRKIVKLNARSLHENNHDNRKQEDL